MTRHTLPALMALELCGACAPAGVGAGPAPAPGDDAANPRPAGGVDREWNRRNLEGFILPYDTAATFVSGSSVLRGKARSARGTESHTLRTGTPTGVLAFRDLEVRMLGRDHALVVGRYVVSDRASARESATGIFSLTLARRPEGWRIIHDHSS